MYHYAGNNPVRYTDPDGNAAIDWIQNGLDVVGCIPAFGEAADGINAVIYLCRGDYVSAALSAASMIPVVGDAVGKGGKVARQVVKHSDDIVAVGKQIVKHADDATELALKKCGKSSSKIDYKKVFFWEYPELENKVVVHHSVEQQVLTKPQTKGLFSYEEMHSLDNLRGIPKDINSDLHLSKIRKEWNRFYKEVSNPTKQQLLEKAAEIDSKYGHLFNPPLN